MRFSIRDLLWAMLVVAMALGWWRESAESEIRKEKFLLMEDRWLATEIRAAELNRLVEGKNGPPTK